MTELRKLFDKYGTDRGSKHRYDEIYEKYWSQKKDEPINLLEIGVWKGPGMEATLDYFPNGNVYGVDIFTRIRPEEVKAFQHPRAHWLKADSMDHSITSLLRKKFDVQYDYIVDDGAHYPLANMLTFKHTIEFLKPGGSYFIEDVWPLEI